jgi:hypothetical protein
MSFKEQIDKILEPHLLPMETLQDILRHPYNYVSIYKVWIDYEASSKGTALQFSSVCCSLLTLQAMADNNFKYTNTILRGYERYNWIVFMENKDSKYTSIYNPTNKYTSSELQEKLIEKGNKVESFSDGSFKITSEEGFSCYTEYNTAEYIPIKSTLESSYI